MNQAAKILLPVLLAAGGVSAFLALRNDGPPPLPPSVTEPEKPAPPQPIDKPGPAMATVEPRSEAPEGDRQQVNRVTANEARQGVRGRILLPSMAPAANATVYLMRSPNADPLQLYIASKLRQRILPAGQCPTDENGMFAIGIDKADDTYDLRVVTTDYPELQHKGIRPLADDWCETGELVLAVGGIVQGTVVDEVAGFPIPGAKVYLQDPQIAYQMLPTPGRERGITGETNSSGFFRFTNAPREGLLNVGAEAEGYAFSELPNQQIKSEAANEFSIKLVKGEPIGGIVVDQTGKPIGGATINATAKSAKLPQTSTAGTAPDGRFLLPLLRPGPYQLQVTAPHFEETTEPMVMTGNDEVKIVLERRGRVRLRVLSAKRTPIRAYLVSLKRYFPNNPGSIGKVPEFRDMPITPANYEGEYAIIPSVPNGDFVFQITDANHAKTLSPPFSMTVGGEPTVEVTLTNGASITGIVLDDRGRPVPEATVATDMNGGMAAESSFLEIFRHFLPDKHTTKSVKTDGGGRFVISRLAFAEYMLRVSHPDFCEALAIDIKLDSEGQMKDVGTLTLQLGANIDGVCRISGVPSGQVKVIIGPPDNYKPEVDEQGRPKMMFSAQAISANDGSYRLLKRVPPGTYKIYCFKEAGGDGLFDRIKQMKDTGRQLVVSPGQDRITVDFEFSL